MNNPHWLTAVVREPFFQFLVLGTLIVVGTRMAGKEQGRYVIHVGPAELRRLDRDFVQRFLRRPTPAEEQQLIARYVKDEIYYREGLALRLDQGDEIIRRRIVQKYEFLRTGLTPAQSPSAAELEDWFERHQDRYAVPERVSFSHVYFSVDEQGKHAARARAERALDRLRQSNPSRAPEMGDSFPGPTDLTALQPDEARRLFGRSELVERLFTAAPGIWLGPFRSGYGWHLIRVTQRLPAASAPLATVHDRVLADYLDAQRATDDSQGFNRLRARYVVKDTD